MNISKGKNLENIGKAALPLHDTAREFCRRNGVPTPSSLSSAKDRTYVNIEDEQAMLEILMRKGDNVFVKTDKKEGRTNKDFEKICANPLASMDENKLRKYVMAYGATMADIEDCLYSRWFTISGLHSSQTLQK